MSPYRQPHEPSSPRPAESAPGPALVIAWYGAIWFLVWSSKKEISLVLDLSVTGLLVVFTAAVLWKRPTHDV
jgi:hypothetical protein